MATSLTSTETDSNNLAKRAHHSIKEDSKRALRAPPAQISADILNDDLLNAAIQTYLPSNYNFEIHKTIHHVRHYGSTCVALQMPEGLTLWATAISDIIERFVHQSGRRL